MKIISKYHDFYDSCGPYDEIVPVYLRASRYFTSSGSYSKKDSEIDKEFPNFRKLFDSKFNVRKKALKYWGPAVPEVYYVGIYPNIYPVLLTCREQGWRDLIKGPQDIVPYVPKDKYIKEILSGPVEFPEIFKEISAPVFIYSPKNIIFDKKYTNIVKELKNVSLIVNPILQNITPSVLNKLDLNPLKVYNDIENFLWSMKEEPILEPSNSTKILAAGFDMKTSFRNM